MQAPEMKRRRPAKKIGTDPGVPSSLDPMVRPASQGPCQELGKKNRDRPVCPCLFLLQFAGVYSGLMFDAAGPFWPCVTSKETFWPSFRDLKPVP